MAEAINILSEFCGPRDIEAPVPEALQRRYGMPQLDVAVLFGGSILAGGDVMAEAMRTGLARKYAIVGGAGHTTEALRHEMAAVLWQKVSPQASEAELFDAYLRQVCGRGADALECASTNCGNNITFLIELLERQDIPHESLLFIQDASMQRRMTATWRRQAGEQALVVNYAAYRVHVVMRDGALCFAQTPAGMWPMERYVRLLMGDAARLQDNAEGYGPKGRDFIAHVDVPDDVLAAFHYLKRYFEVRKAIEQPSAVAGSAAPH